VSALARWSPVALLAGLALIAPLLDDFWLSLLTLVFFSALVGVAWNVAMGFAGLLSLGHALYLGLGGYTTAFLAERLGIIPWLGIPAGAAVAAAAGALIAWLAFRFAVRGVYFALLTLAFAELARVLFDNWALIGGTGGLFLGALDAATNNPLVSLRGGARFFYLAFLVALAAAYFTAQLLYASRLGFWWRALREDEDAARAVGVPALRCRIAASAISAAMTGVAGGLFALFQGSLFPDSFMGMRMSIDIIVAPIVGGLGSLVGPILGAFFTVPFARVSSALSESAGIAGLNTLIFGVILLCVVVFLPDGLGPRLALALRLRRDR
jgi:branched-chain amino acid transport system permease protein